MSYKLKATFAEGVTQDQIALMLQNMGLGPDSPAPGNLSHEQHIENGRVVFVEEWESKAIFDSFLSQRAGPALAKTGIPPAEIEEL